MHEINRLKAVRGTRTDLCERRLGFARSGGVQDKAVSSRAGCQKGVIISIDRMQRFESYSVRIFAC